MKTTTLLGSISLLLVTATGCGSGLKCADGTFKSGGKCIAFDPDDETAPVTTIDPPGGRTRNETPTFATLTTNEPSLIYWTNDGSEPDLASGGHPSPALVTNLVDGATVKFFAVDAAGNQEATRSVTFIYDVFVGALTDVTIAASDSAALISWTNPTDEDLAGVLLARVDPTTPLDLRRPQPDQFYAVGATTLGSSLDIVLAGTATSFNETGLVPGESVRFLAWTYDQIGNYSAPQPIDVRAALGTLSGSLSVNATTLAVTVNTQPEFLVLSGTALYNGGTSTLTVSVSIENQTLRALHNPKVVVTNVSGGAAAFTQDGLLGGSPYRYFGPQSIVPAGTRTQTLVFTGVLVTDTVNFDVAVADHPSLIGGKRTRQTNAGNHIGIDLGTGVAHPPLTVDGAVTGPGFNYGGPEKGGYRTGITSADGRYLRMGSTKSGIVATIDLATRTYAGGTLLTNSDDRCNGGAAGCGSTKEVVTDGTTIFALANSSHREGAGVLVRLDQTLAETARISLPYVGYGRRGLALTQGGDLLAVAPDQGSQVIVLDAWAMTELDFDPSTQQVDRLDFNETDIRSFAFSRDNRWLYAIRRDSSVILRGDLIQGETSQINLGASGRIFDLHVDATNRLWIAADFQLLVYDPADETVAVTAYPYAANAFAEVEGKLYILRNNRTSVDEVDSTGAIVRTMTAGNTFYGHWIAVTP